MQFNERAMVIVDLETTGLDPSIHEVIEIGAVRVDQESLELEALFQAKIQPQHLEVADPISLKVNGYTPEKWADAVNPVNAWASFFAFSRQSVFCSYSNIFDWSFTKTPVEALYAFSENRDIRRFGPFERHLIDIPSVAYGILGPMAKMGKNDVAKALGLGPEAEPHGALNGALHALETLRMLRKYQEVRNVLKAA